MTYSYHGRRIERKGDVAHVTIPAVDTRVELGGDADTLAVEEGIAFSPVYHLALKKTISKGAVTSWLRLRKAN